MFQVLGPSALSTCGVVVGLVQGWLSFGQGLVKMPGMPRMHGGCGGYTPAINVVTEWVVHPNVDPAE